MKVCRVGPRAGKFMEALESLRPWLSVCSSHIGYETGVTWYKGFINEKMVKLIRVSGIYYCLCMLLFSSLLLFVFGNDCVTGHTRANDNLGVDGEITRQNEG